MPTYTFGGIACPPRADDRVAQVSPGESLYSVRPIPFSNRSVLDLGGIGPRRFAAEIKVAPASAAAFEALLQASAVLVANGVTYSRATLVELSDKQVTPRNDWVFYTASWIVG